MNDHNHTTFDITCDYTEETFGMQVKENLHTTFIKNIEIKGYKMTNIFEENAYLSHIMRRFEQQSDHLSAVHCSNIIEKLPTLCDFEVYKLHIKWFCDEFIVYATNRPNIHEITHSKHIQRQICEKLRRHKIYIVGFIEEPY